MVGLLCRGRQMLDRLAVEAVPVDDYTLSLSSAEFFRKWKLIWMGPPEGKMAVMGSTVLSEMEVDLDGSSRGEDGSDGLKISWEHGNEDESLKMAMEVEVEMQKALKLVGVHSERDFVDLSTPKHLKSVEIADASNDVLKSDYGIINLLKNQMGAMTFIQAIDFKDVLPKCQDEATIVLGFFNVISDDIEFYFKNGEDMAKFVGVGLDHAKVVVKRGIIFEVHEIEREDWKRVWLEVEGGSNLLFKIMKVALPRARRGGMENMQHEDVCNFATSSASLSSGSFQDYPPIASNNTFQIPLLWELSKYFIMGSVIDTLNTKFNVDILGESSAVSSTEDYPKDGNDTEMTWVQTVLNLFSIGASHSFYSINGGNRSQEKECEGGNGTGNGGGDDNDHRGISKLNLSEDKFKFSRVTVILLCGGDFKPSLTRSNSTSGRFAAPDLRAYLVSLLLVKLHDGRWHCLQHNDLVGIEIRKAGIVW